MQKNHTIYLTGAFLLSVSAADVAAEAGKSLKDQLAEFTTDLAVPISPAAAHIGLSQENVLLPRNRREFDVGVSKAFGNSGKPTGSIEVSPYYMLQGGRLDYIKYRDNWAFRTGTKTTFGLAAGTRKIDTVEISATGYSFSSVLFDLGDPIYSHALQRCINRVQEESISRAKRKLDAEQAIPLPTTNDRGQFEPSDEREDPDAQKAYKSCVGKRESELWNRTRLSVGVAGGSGRESVTPSRHIAFGTGVWVTAQYGFENFDILRRVLGSGERYSDCAVPKENGTCEKYSPLSNMAQHAMGTFHMRHTRNASDLDFSKTGELTKLSNTLIAGRLTYGSDKRSIFLEASRAFFKTGATTKRTDQYAFGGSVRVQEGLWLNVVSGRRKLFVDGKPDNVIELNLQFGATNAGLVASQSAN